MASRTLISMIAIALISASLFILIDTEDTSATVGDTFTVGDYSYEVTKDDSSKEVKVTGFSGEAVANVVIPDTVTHGSVYEVTEIGMSAFDGNLTITSVDLGNVETIGIESFAGCINLTTVSGSEVTSVGSMAFSGCVKLEAFEDAKPTTIGISSFTGCVKLADINLSKAVTIGSMAFMECRALETVNFGTLLVSIGSYAFYDSGITSVSIPIATTLIGGSAFNKCSNLASISVGFNVRFAVTDNGALYQKSNNKILTMPQAREVPGGSFVIPGNIEAIDDGAFDGCTNITSVTIPASVTSIGDGIFRNCSNLTTVTVSGGTSFKTINNCLYSYDGTSIYFVPQNYSGAYVAPATLTTVEPYSFDDCASITSVDIRNVTSIGTYAFTDCYSMQVMYVKADATIEAMAFDLGSVGSPVTCEIRSTGVDFIGLAAKGAFTTLNYALPVRFVQDGTVPAGVDLPDSVYVLKNETLNLTTYKQALERFGYTMSLDGTPFEGNTVSVTTSPRTLTFTFDGTAYYTITFDTKGGSAVAPLRLNVGTAVPAVAAPVRAGYEFIAWTPSIPSVMPAEDLTITASWTKAISAGDVITDGDTKKISADSDRADVSKEAVDALKDGSSNVQMSVNSVTIKMTTESFGKLAGTGNISLTVGKSTGVKNQKLLDNLSEAKKKIAEKAVVLDISFTTTGVTSDLGTVTFTVPYVLAPGQTVSNIYVYYVADDGTITELKSSYADGNLSVETSHFSTFAVCNGPLSDPDPVDPGSGDDPKGSGMNLGLIIGGVVGAIVVVGVVVFLIKKH